MTTIPNEKLITYLSAKEQKEYNMIIKKAQLAQIISTDKHKTLVDYILIEDYPRYNELLDIAEQNKLNAPKKPRNRRTPMTQEQKAAKNKKKLLDAQAALDALLSSQKS
jgi:hypothetical protein